ncbi:hypothetical protein XI07_04425 [Bradyrhizobium sp. CCBAU 11445]|nr:hypothetical protein [Bradyrhizobium sp. CCBAU 25360]MDA9445686.1 hypothetical protein [Bradyrhizobium sp. CCBAU 21360]MDA9459950.1 hypothetical protein [Bradyrhizobium sp. CCBAU 21359]MDA9473242.1 hypothetical protein [Bradyrhizobium sp. CCBAU 65884]MDA9481288.1 hypothetical protein [Bradyrhizobium sp. CCBAU 11445]
MGRRTAQNRECVRHLISFLCSIRRPFLRPDLPSRRRRAPRPSRMAVALVSPHVDCRQATP